MKLWESVSSVFTHHFSFLLKLYGISVPTICLLKLKHLITIYLFWNTINIIQCFNNKKFKLFRKYYIRKICCNQNKCTKKLSNSVCHLFFEELFIATHKFLLSHKIYFPLCFCFFGFFYYLLLVILLIFFGNLSYMS